MGSQTSEATIINGNSLEELQQLPANSVDSVVTDPPYGLSFMGKKWDYDVPSKELWQEVYRVLKPGGHVLAFAGTRTQHRMAVNIEDAGFEIRDMIAWVYGSGFPKSLNIGKAVDKVQGNEREDLGYNNNSRTNTPENDVYEAGMRGKESRITKGNSEWEGWGTSLKPALEPITVARKPIKGSVANNVLEWGTGGINIDGCRVEAEPELAKNWIDRKAPAGFNGDKTGIYGSGKTNTPSDYTPTGRFPANFTHDGSDEVVGLFPDSNGGAFPKQSNIPTGKHYDGGWGAVDNGKRTEMGSGSAARFFYCAKASKSERNKGLEGFEDIKLDIGDVRPSGSFNERFGHNEPLPTKNAHPTVKPIKLMQYLVRLVTPKGGLVLDPFNGSGTTGIACKLEGFNYLGIELDPEYCAISTARIAAWEPEPAMHEQAVLL